MRRYGLIADFYADVIVFDQDDPAETIKRIEASVMVIKARMAMDWLKLNAENTLSLLLRTPTVRPLSNISEIIIGENNITPSPIVRKLGAIFEEHGGACQQCFLLFLLPPAQHQQHSKSAGYEHRPDLTAEIFCYVDFYLYSYSDSDLFI